MGATFTTEVCRAIQACTLAVRAGSWPSFRVGEVLRTSLDAEANGRETMLHQALSSSAGHFVAQRLRVSCMMTDVLFQTPAAQELLPGGELSEQSW